MGGGLVVFWGILYAAPGVAPRDIQEQLGFNNGWLDMDTSKRRAAMRTLGWKPDEPMKVLRQTGKDTHRDTLLERHGGFIESQMTFKSGGV